MSNKVAEFAGDTTKNLGDFSCDASFWIQDKAKCHENVAAAAEKVKGAVEDPVGTAIKTTLEGPINDFLISMWKGAVNFRHLLRHGLMLALLLVLKKTRWTG